ncbi:MAG: DUF5309 domain-containing protein [Muribaculaceae bacterium]|nr:DUF5309 domain-containing protein [Muribaculaceae bacterium]
MNENIVTTALTRELAPGLLRNTIDERVASIRPMSTPLDQISRMAGSRSCKSMKVEYYSVDTKPLSAKIRRTSNVTVAEGELAAVTIYTDNDDVFQVSETLLVPRAAIDVDGEQLMPQLLVTGRPTKAAGGGVECVVTNVPAGRSVSFSGGMLAVRMGRAATELDVQTPQFVALPRKEYNYCQIFKMQIEQSTAQRIQAKEVGWTFSDQEEAAVIDMRMGMEKNFLFGTRSCVELADGREVYLTGGIWTQTDHQMTIPTGPLTDETVGAMCREAFTGNNGSRRKILLAGTDLVDRLSRLSYNKNVGAMESRVKWGIELKELKSNFGTLYVVHSEVLDQCGHESDGFVLDPDYVTKYCHTPFSVETLDLRTSGQRNTDAVVLTEIACLALRYPNTHMRVVSADTND